MAAQRGGRRAGAGRPRDAAEKKTVCLRLSEDCLSGMKKIAEEHNLPQSTVLYAAIKLLTQKLAAGKGANSGGGTSA